jgi:peptidoglycan-associated lipoprotein
MKKLAIVGGVAAALLLVTGCSKKEQPKPQPEQKPAVVKTEPQPEPEPQPQKPKVDYTAQLKATIQQQIPEIVVYFDFDKYNLKPSEAPKVERLAELLKKYPGKICVRIEGNTDEWGTEEYNYALGLKRANTVKKALVDAGVDPNYLTVISYGETHPVCDKCGPGLGSPNGNCCPKNRRDNFTILNSDGDCTAVANQ